MSRSVSQAPEQVGGQFEQILTAARSGGGWASERLWRSLAPAVAGYLRVQGAAEPDDVTSEVFLAVFRGLDDFTGTEAQFRSWVFTIAHRRLLDERRRARRRPAVPMGTDLPDARSGASAENEALHRLGVERVKLLCGRLVPDQRDVLLLRLVAGLTVEEVAAIVDKSPGAVKALQRRGLLGLRKLVDREGVPL